MARKKGIVATLGVGGVLGIIDILISLGYFDSCRASNVLGSSPATAAIPGAKKAAPR